MMELILDAPWAGAAIGGAAAGVFLILHLCRRHRSLWGGLSVPLAALLGLLGGRVAHWLFRPEQYDGFPDAITRLSGGYSLWGVLVGCAIAGLVFLLPGSKAKKGAFSVHSRAAAGMLPLRILVLLAVTGTVVLTVLRATVLVWAGGRFLPASASYLDLTGKDITLRQYEQIHQALPDCRIDWDVPVQGRRYSPAATVVTVTDPGLADAEMLRYLPQLEMLDARNCTDWEALAAYLEGTAEYPCRITVLGAEVSTDCTALTLADADAAALRRVLPLLKDLKALTLDGALPPAEERIALVQDYPDIQFLWDVSLLGETYSSNTKELDLSGQTLPLSELENALDQMPALEQVNLLDSGLTQAELTSLCQRYPGCSFLWEAEIAGQKYRTDATELDLSRQNVGPLEDLEEVLSCFPQLTRVDMSRCGIDDETMEALNQRHGNIKFVWTVYFRGHAFQTDSPYFYPWKLDKNLYMDNKDMYPLRYCHDIECIDIGHNFGVTDCEWVRYMPKLRYLIIGETGITDLTPLSTCKNLVYLEMFTLKVTDLTPLQGCTALEDLNLGRVYDADPEPLTKMTWLKNLWWANVDGTYGRAASNAKEILTPALTSTRLEFNLAHPVSGGWRQLPNYYAQRDLMGMFYLP